MLTVRSIVVYEKLLSEDDCLRSGGVMQINARLRRGGLSGRQ